MPDAGVPVASRPFHRPSDSHVRKSRQQLLEEHPEFESGQIGTQAVVHTLSEAQVRIGFTADIELIGMVEDQLISVG
jgi:hypothetical protein